MHTDFLKIRQIFEAIVARPPAQWDALMDEACGKDTDQRGQVAALFKAHAEAAGILDRNVADKVSTEFFAQSTECPGTLIGPYKLLEQIGEGGFGVVFMAEQLEPIRRKVALKIIKPGMDTKQVIARFEAERQALALMDHANIAKVLDAGTTGFKNADFRLQIEEEAHTNLQSESLNLKSAGRPYFVMELVKGLPITEFCDQGRLTLKERLELFGDVCRAVQHAHQKGIIHRDIKPSNVLVTMQDGAPLVKVIDFGIAKALGQQLTDKTLFTNFAQMIGTPLYMSPEQAALSNVDVDTRADIYSLGVLLYELLTGTTPFDKERLHTAGYDEMRRIIREEEPPKPSTRLSTLGQKASTVSAQRKSDLRLLCKLLRGDLDWIVMKALDKDRNRRYETANGFAEDIQRYLVDEPVLARAPTTRYRLRKFARRHRRGLTMGVVVTAALAVLAVGIGLMIRDRTAREAEVTRQVRDSLAAAHALLDQNQPAQARQKVGVAKVLIGNDRETLPDLAAEIDASEAELEGLRRFMDLVDKSHANEASGVIRSRAKPWTGDLLLEGLECYEVLNREDWIARLELSVLGKYQVAQIRRTVYELLLRLADQVARAGFWDQSRWGKYSPESGAQRALVYLGIAEKAHARSVSFYRIRATCYKTLGHEDAARADDELTRRTPRTMAIDCYLEGLALGLRAEALKAFGDGLVLEPEHFWLLMAVGNHLISGGAGAGPDHVRAGHIAFTGCIMKRPDYADAYKWRGQASFLLSQFEDGVKDCSKALELDPTDSSPYVVRAAIYEGLGRWDKALADYSKAVELGDEHMRDGRFRMYKKLGLLNEALAEIMESIKHTKALLEMGKLSAPFWPWMQRGEVYGMMGQWDKALADHSEAIKQLPKLAATWNNRALAYAHLGQRENALADFSKALSLNKKDVLTREGLCGYANLSQTALFEKALAELTNAMEMEPTYADYPSVLAYFLATHADPKLRDPRRAVELAKKAVALDHHDIPRDYLYRWRQLEKGWHLNTLGIALYRVGECQAALEALKNATEFKKNLGGRNWFFLAMAHWRLGHKGEARQVYQQAVDWMNANEPKNDELRRFRAEAAELLDIKEQPK